MKSSILLVTSASLMVFSNSTYAQDQCMAEQARIDEITTTYKEKFADLEKDANELEKRAGELSDDTAENTINVDVDITMKEQRIVFDTPSVTMKERRMVFSLPQTTFKIQSIKFDVPQTRFVNKKTGQYPETRCTDTWISLPFGGRTKGVPKCTVKWSDIITKVPEVYIETTEIKTKIPEFTWDETEIIVAIPEFFMERQEIILNLPEVKVTDVGVERRAVQSEGEKISSRSESLQEEQSQEIRDATAELYDCYEIDIAAQRSKTSEQFTKSLDEIDSSISEMKSAGIDPTNLNTPDGKVDLIAIRRDIENKRNDAFKSFDDALQQMKDERQATLDRL